MQAPGSLEHRPSVHRSSRHRRSLIGGIAAGALVIGTLTACSPVEPPAVPDTPSPTSTSAAPAAPQAVKGEPSSQATSASPVVEAEAKPAGEAKTLVRAPKSVRVSGTLMMVHPESADQVSEEARAEVAADPTADAPAKDLSLFNGGALLATDGDGPLIQLDSSVVGSDAETGQEFSGEITLSDAEQQLVQRKIDADGGVSESAAVELLNTEAEQSGERLDVSGTVALLSDADEAADGASELGAAAGATAAAKVKKKRHTAHVFYFKNKKRKGYSKRTLIKMVKNTGSYWRSQTAGKITSIKVKDFDYTKKRFNYCNQAALWKYAAKRFKKSSRYFTKGAHHLVVFVDSGCGRGLAGLGIIGSLHKGGPIWVDLAYKSRTNMANPNSAVKTTGFNIAAHEIGHNLGLGHAQARVCSPSSGMSGAIDSAVTWKRDPGVGGYRSLRAKAPCEDVEYGDNWNVMGSSATVKPPALGMAQKWALGVMPSGGIRQVSRSGGVQQTFTLKSAGTSSGLRGLKVDGGKSGTLFVEYRNSTGWDSGWGLTGNAFYAMWGDNGQGMMNNGVHVLKGYTKSKVKKRGKWRYTGYKRSSVIMARQSFGPGYEGQAHGLFPGKSLTPYGTGVTITTVSMNATEAVVRITYR